MILADTSAWVEYDRATGSRVDLRLEELIRGDGPLVVTEPVIMEVVAGARTDERESDLRRLLLRFDCSVSMPPSILTAPHESTAVAAKQASRLAGMVDCMIASVAHRHRAMLLTADADLNRVAPVIGIELDQPQPEPPQPT